MGFIQAIVNLNCVHHIRNINDPEHPLTLEQLNVVEESRVKVAASACMQNPDNIYKAIVLL